MSVFHSLAICVLLSICACTHAKDLIVLAAPAVEDTYDDDMYAAVFDDIVAFDVGYINAAYGKDKILILVDKATRKFYTGKVPEDVLIDADPQHIWMRDFTTVNPYKPVQFRYTPVTFQDDQSVADGVQDDFDALLKRVGVSFPKAYYKGKYLMLDGGNIVDNYKGRVVTTERFLDDNGLTYEQGVDALKQTIGAKQVAIIPADDPILAHSDGMVMFSDENTLFVNRYDEPFRSEVLEELVYAFPGIKIIEVPVAWDAEKTSACGVNLNATVTQNTIYMPHFGDATSDRVLKIIQEHTDKTVIPVPANGVCKLGGSVRCLSWQQSGRQGDKVYKALVPAGLRSIVTAAK